MIKNVKLSALKEPKFVKTQAMSYEQDGVKKLWEIADVHDSVAILIYNAELEKFILVKQFRPAVFLKNSEGYTIELCAGIVDKKSSLERIAQEEVLEECGYSCGTLEKITSFYTAVGFAGAQQTLYYVEVDESQKVDEGGGIDLEQIEVLYLSKEEAQSLILDENVARTPGLMFALSWWFAQH